VTKIITVINIISLILETNKPQIELSTLSDTALGQFTWAGGAFIFLRGASIRNEIVFCLGWWLGPSQLKSR